MLQARIKKQLEEIDLEFRRNAALRDGTIKFDDYAYARGKVTYLVRHLFKYEYPI